MSGPVFDLAPSQRVTGERYRLAKLLAAIDRTRLAKAKAAKEGLSEAAEYLALQEFMNAEVALFELILDPDLFTFLTAAHGALVEMAEELSCV